MGRASDVTAVLVHGAGHTSRVWRATQAAMAWPSIAVDLPGRGARPADITRVTVDQAADAIADDVRRRVDGDVVLVGHSAAGTILPSAAARLDGRVRHLVYVAGISAPDGEVPVGEFMPDDAEAAAAYLDRLRERHAGKSLEAMDEKTAGSIDSLNFCSQPMAWAGIADSIGRTFVRCLRDPIQPRDLQDRFIANCGAGEVIDVDSGHTPALDAPVALGAALDRVLARVASTAAQP